VFSIFSSEKTFTKAVAIGERAKFEDEAIINNEYYNKHKELVNARTLEVVDGRQ